MATNIWSIARKRNATFRFCIKIKIKIRTDRKIQKKLASEYSKTKIIHLLITILNDDTVYALIERASGSSECNVISKI